MIKRSISGRLALMFALASILIVSVLGIVLRSSLHDSLQKQMHNELQFRESLMAPWILSRTTLDGWQTLTTKFTDLATAEGAAYSIGSSVRIPGFRWVARHLAV